MAFDGIQRYLNSVTGLNVDTVGATIVERAVRRRMEVCEIASVSQYEQEVKTSATELQALINEISVPETWFFRDGKPFQLLSQYAKAFAEQHSTGLPLRVLSIPCSTGEEAYSIAMTLIDAGYRPDQFVIDAVDISTAVIDTARQGCYGQNSFRGDDIDYRQRYFTMQDNRYLIDEEVKLSVTFQQGNLLEDDFMASKSPYHVIFCRNLLIYFGLANKSKALHTLHGLLAVDGVLFLGHAETGRMAEGLFSSAGVTGAFAYKKMAKPVVSSSILRDDFSKIMRSLSVKPQAVPSLSVAGIDKTTLQHDPAGEKGTDDLAGSADEEAALLEIEHLADAGELAQARQRCEQFLSQRPDSAQCYHLQGVIHLAGAEDEAAVEAFRKALYLKPDHYQALIHLSVLAQKQGDAKAAQNYRARAQRIAQEATE